MSKKPAAAKKPTAAETKAALAAAAPPAESAVETPAAADPIIQASDPILAHDELLDVARAKDPKFADQGVKEDDKTYILRVISVVASVDDPTFNAMQADTIEWYNTAVTNEGEDKPFDMPAGFVSKFGATKAPKAAADPKAPKPAKEAKAPKAPKAAKAPREKKTDGLVARSRRIVLANLNKPLGELMKLPETGDIKRSTMSVTFGWTHDALRDMKAMGMLSEKAAAQV